jgi:hypothetical protein
MPCYVSAGEELHYAQATINHLTKLLCEAVKRVDGGPISDELHQWIESHKLNDALRIKTEIKCLQSQLDKITAQ